MNTTTIPSRTTIRTTSRTTSRTINRPITAKVVLAATVVMSACALVPVPVEAGPVEDIERSCLADASGSADSLERWVDHCQEIAGDYREMYDDCMRNAAGTPDSLERWVDQCAARSADVGDNG